ncbi:MAG: hypothetical protein Q7U56_03085 [Humidesulfovibrio sp.]|nr:hypothetical protein [Desulfovibrio sp.]MDO9082252.1 hypothetical protein [Humidesulfovibrio sp.]
MDHTPVGFSGQPTPARALTLPNDFGQPISLVASLVAEDIHFSTTTGLLTVEKLYRTAQGRMGYGIIAASGESRERRAYTLDDQGETVVCDNGAFAVELPVGDLHELLCMALQAEDALRTVGEHAYFRPAVNEE